jgi:hypothetical protein
MENTSLLKKARITVTKSRDSRASVSSSLRYPSARLPTEALTLIMQALSGISSVQQAKAEPSGQMEMKGKITVLSQNALLAVVTVVLVIQ